MDSFRCLILLSVEFGLARPNERRETRDVNTTKLILDASSWLSSDYDAIMTDGTGD